MKSIFLKLRQLYWWKTNLVQDHFRQCSVDDWQNRKYRRDQRWRNSNLPWL